MNCYGYEESHDNMRSRVPRIDADPYLFQDVRLSQPRPAALDSSYADIRLCDALPVHGEYSDSPEIAPNSDRRFSRAGTQRVSAPVSLSDASSPGSTGSIYSNWLPRTAAATSSQVGTTPSTHSTAQLATTTAAATTTTTLLIILFLIFLTMIILIIVLCRLCELQKTADFIVNHQQTLMHASFYAQ